MNPSRRCLFVAASVAALFAAYPATAQPYPSHPVTMIVPASAGGPNIIAKLNAAVVKSLAEPGTKEKLAALGQDIPPAEIEKWWLIVKAAGIKAE